MRTEFLEFGTQPLFTAAPKWQAEDRFFGFFCLCFDIEVIFSHPIGSSLVVFLGLSSLVGLFFSGFPSLVCFGRFSIFIYLALKGSYLMVRYIYFLQLNYNFKNYIVVTFLNDFHYLISV